MYHQVNEICEQRREALESYEDELHEELVLKTVLTEQRVIEKFRNIVYPVVDLRTRDLIKAKVKYLMDPVMNMKFEAELQGLKDTLKFLQLTEEVDLTNEQVYESWRILEKGNIAREQKVGDFTRENP